MICKNKEWIFNVSLKYNSFETNKPRCRPCRKGEGSCEFQGRRRPDVNGDPAEPHAGTCAHYRADFWWGATATESPQWIQSRSLDLRPCHVANVKGKVSEKYQIQTNISPCSWAQVLKKILRAFSRTPSIIPVKVWFQKAFILLVEKKDHFQSFSLCYHCFCQTCRRVLPYYSIAIAITGNAGRYPCL